MRLIFLLFSISFMLSAQQASWEKVRSIVPNSIFSFDADSSGNYFYTLYNSQIVGYGNIYSREKKVYPRVKEIRFSTYKNRVEVFIDKGQIPIINHSNTMYYYKNKQFLIDTVRKAGRSFDQLKYDENSTLYFLDWKYILRYKDGLYSQEFTQVAEFSTWIQAAFMYNRDSNFLVISEFESNKADIVQLNSESGEFKTLFSINTPMREVDQSILYKDGRFIIPTERELIYYKDYGKHYEVPLIDSADQSRGKISVLSAGKVNGEIIVNKGSKFYFSYDDLKTWVPAGALNKGFPKGPIQKFVLWDSLHSVALILDDCIHERLYVFDNPIEGWREMHQLDYDNSEFSSFQIDEQDKLIGKVFTCGWVYKDRLDSVWSPIYSPGKVNGNFEGYLSNYLVTDKTDFGYNAYSLYSTDNYGKTWDSVMTFAQGIRSLNYFGKGYVLLSTLVGNSYSFYVSKDYGKNFKYSSSVSDNNFPIERLKLDYDGNLIAANTGTFSSPFYILKEGSNRWTIDERFNNLQCRSFDFAEDGRYFLDIEYNGLRGIYSTYDFKNFYNISEKLGWTFAYTIKYLGSGEFVLSTSNQDGIRGIYYSNDNGVTLQDITYDFKYIRDDLQYGAIYGFYLDKDRSLYARTSNYGIYKLSDVLSPVAVKEVPKITESVVIFPHPTTNEISISAGDKYSFDRYNIYDINSKLIKQDKLVSKHILVNDLVSGVYVLQLINGENIIWTGRFVKI